MPEAGFGSELADFLRDMLFDEDFAPGAAAIDAGHEMDYKVVDRAPSGLVCVCTMGCQ